jgi:hypothetical protein
MTPTTLVIRCLLVACRRSSRCLVKRRFRAVSTFRCVILCSQAADIHDERRLLEVWQASLGAVERLQEATVVAFRKQTLLSLDDCLYALQETIPHLTRSSLHRCLQRHGISPPARDRRRQASHSSAIPSATSTSISPRFALRKVSFTYFVAVDRTSLSPNCTRARASISPQASSKPRSRRSRTNLRGAHGHDASKRHRASTCWHHSGPSPLTTRD